jgi:hypothetical protein
MRSLKEILARCYRDLVKGRSKVRVVKAQSQFENCFSPIFIVGVYRSGTTMLRYILDSHSNICCPPESDFITPLSKVLTDTRSATGLKNMGYDNEHVLGRLRDFVNYVFLNYAQSVGKKRWADKTPGYIDCLDFIAKLYPEAKFVMLYRHGLDQAHSMTRGGTHVRGVFKDYCNQNEDFRIGAVRYWNKKVNLMQAFEEKHSDQCIRLVYEKICSSPQQEIKTLFQFLNEDFEPTTLQYSNFNHTMGAEDGRALAAKEIQPASSHFMDWPEPLRVQCMAIANTNLTSLGFPATVESNYEAEV